MYLVFARKYRPQRFEDVVGQAHVVRTLQNAVRNDRVAHAYLFCGNRGTGKTSVARILAKALNCAQGPTPEPCGQCESCRRIANGDDLDVMEIDGASNRGIDEIRQLREKVRYAPARSRYKVYYVDEVHMLTQPAFNALLKTLEEPPEHVKFIFSTTDPQQLLDTVKSRCQRFDFRRISDAEMIVHLRAVCEKENLEPERGALETIARSARGSLRDALGTLDQIAAFSEGQARTEDILLVLGAARTQSLTQIVDALADRQTGAALSLVRQVLFSGVDLIDLVDQFSEYLRDLLVATCCDPGDELLAGAAADAETLARQSALFSQEQLIYMIQILREAKLRARRDTTGRLALEIAIVKLSRLDDLIPLEEALARGGGGPDGQAETGRTGALAHIQNMRRKLLNRRDQPPGNARGNQAEAAPSDRPRQGRERTAGSPLAEELRDDPVLRKAFEEADRQIGLKPIGFGRNGGPRPPEPESEGRAGQDET